MEKQTNCCFLLQIKFLYQIKNWREFQIDILKKILEIGNIINKKIIYLQKKTFENEIEKLQILILGGSQAAEVFGEKLPAIFKKCSSKGVPIKIYQHCLPHQNDKIKTFYSNAKIEFETLILATIWKSIFQKLILQ